MGRANQGLQHEVGNDPFLIIEVPLRSSTVTIIDSKSTFKFNVASVDSFSSL